MCLPEVGMRMYQYGPRRIAHVSNDGFCTRGFSVCLIDFSLQPMISAD